MRSTRLCAKSKKRGRSVFLVRVCTKLTTRWWHFEHFELKYKTTKLAQGRHSYSTRDNKRREAISITSSHLRIDRSFVRWTKTRRATHPPLRATRLSPLAHPFQLVYICAPCICTHAIQHAIHNALQIDRRTMINVDAWTSKCLLNERDHRYRIIVSHKYWSMVTCLSHLNILILSIREAIKFFPPVFSIEWLKGMKRKTKGTLKISFNSNYVM